MCNKCGCLNPWMGRTPDPRKQIPMSPTEAAIISRAVENALCWGTGILTRCQEEIEDAGFKWEDRHERYIFENYIDNS